MNEIKFNCPTCGTAINITFNTNNANETLGISTEKKSVAKLEALRRAGVDVSNLFSLQGCSGDDALVRFTNGHITQVEDDDEIFRAIGNGGTLKNPHLFRRWIMAQMFRYLECAQNRNLSFNKVIEEKGYGYMWRMAIEELRVQSVLYANGDMEAYKERSKWFSIDVVREMMDEYFCDLKRKVKTIKMSRGCAVDIAKVYGKRYDRTDFEMMVQVIINNADYSWDNLMAIESTSERLRVASEWAKSQFREIKRIGIGIHTPYSKAFLDAFKGVGAYYTMQNMILHHNCKFAGKTKDESIIQLKSYVNKLHKEGWEMLGILKELIKDNNIDMAEKRKEWEIARQMKRSSNNNKNR